MLRILLSRPSSVLVLHFSPRVFSIGILYSQQRILLAIAVQLNKNWVLQFKIRKTLRILCALTNNTTNSMYPLKYYELALFLCGMICSKPPQPQKQTHIYIHIYTCICMYTYMYIYIYTYTYILVNVALNPPPYHLNVQAQRLQGPVRECAQHLPHPTPETALRDSLESRAYLLSACKLRRFEGQFVSVCNAYAFNSWKSLEWLTRVIHSCDYYMRMPSLSVQAQRLRGQVRECAQHPLRPTPAPNSKTRLLGPTASQATNILHSQSVYCRVRCSVVQSVCSNLCTAK